MNKHLQISSLLEIFINNHGKRVTFLHCDVYMKADYFVTTVSLEEKNKKKASVSDYDSIIEVRFLR